ncbi:Outer membrane protein assembly factor BamB, contains PQQ-like beta-propeller repeat [Halogranum amylolyticum]|uniref:Outer membrane protein assembly factor BamB, contains PQQ-like beta-propeller repeat n=1 Tax=Halogranum amylolyticum TaxID=660520 RepID=A0A1H8MYB5_9EURY|nr:PQQ-like beta-propeller repeat protein [Halogranum amylolyticum]SEO22228.1 Outer membrane protein assembly factor BamB, contains PQQ-like beta-propeller repeat [Halogranum amylolyticum]
MRGGVVSPERQRQRGSQRTRRNVLRAGLVALGVGLAGCSSSCPDSDPPDPNVTLRVGGSETGTAATPLPEQTHDWSQYRFDAGHTGFGDGNTVPTADPRVAWRRGLTAAGASDEASPPALADGTLYVGGDNGGLTAFEATTGERRWTHDRVGTTVTPAVAGGSVYVHDAHGVVSLASDDGSVEWEMSLPLPTAAPTVHRDAVVASAKRGVVAFDRETGTRRWEATASTTEGPPAAFGSSVFVADETLAAYDLVDGTRRSLTVGGRRPGPPVATESTLYVGSYDGLRASAHDGDERWTYERQTGGFATPVVTDELVYAVEQPPEGPSAVFALDTDSGDPTPRWCSWLGEGVARAATSDAVLVGTDDGRTLQQFASRFGEVGWQLRAPGRIRPPAVGTDAVFVTTDRGQVVALAEAADA